MTFPAEQVPDGSFFLPHHFLYPLYGVLAIYLLKLNDEEPQPWVIFVSAIIALVGWFHFWPYYHGTGAIIALVGVLGVIGGGLAYSDIPTRWRASVVGLGLFAFDDWVDHALGVDTPVSIIFTEYIMDLLI